MVSRARWAPSAQPSAIGSTGPSAWRPNALLIRGVTQALLGATGPARADLAAAVETGLASGAVDDVFAAAAELALLAAVQRPIALP